MTAHHKRWRIGARILAAHAILLVAVNAILFSNVSAVTSTVGYTAMWVLGLPWNLLASGIVLSPSTFGPLLLVLLGAPWVNLVLHGLVRLCRVGRGR